MQNGALGSEAVIAFVPSTNIEAARTFYRDTLGLTLVSDELPFALVFDANGTMLRVTKVEFFVPQQFTILGWQVGDIAATIRRLNAAGVEMQRYPFEQDELGVWTSPGGHKIAWFKDADGNTLSLTEFAG